MRALIADDHPLYLEAACAHLARRLGDPEVVSARSLPEALTALHGNGAFDLVLLDYFMPGMNGEAGVRMAVAAAGGAPVAVMSGHADPADVAACIGAGARGFLPKTLDAPMFSAALNMILIGGTYVPAEYVTPPPTRPAPAVQPGLEIRELSGREIEVLEMIVAGASNKEIARKLEIQEVTVKLHANRIFNKLGVKNRAQAAVKALDTHLVRRDKVPDSSGLPPSSLN